MNRPLLIGQAPGPNTDPDYPLFPVPTTSAGGRLQQIMGVDRVEYLKTFDFINVLRLFPGKYKRDDKFPMELARAAADAIRPLLAGRSVVLIGRNVANAFGLPPDWDWHAWHDIKVRRRCPVSRAPWMTRLAITPHPSGRSRWYNDEAHKHEARMFWQDLMKGTSEGAAPDGYYFDKPLSLSLPSVPKSGIDVAPPADAG